MSSDHDTRAKRDQHGTDAQRDDQVMTDGGDALPSGEEQQSNGRVWDHEDCPREGCNGELQQQDKYNVMCLSCEQAWSHAKHGSEHQLQTADFDVVAKKPVAVPDGGSTKYSTKSSEETRQQWTTDERRVLFTWRCKPFVDINHRYDTVVCRLVVEFTPGVGMDVLLEARSDDTGKVPDDWSVMVSVESRDGVANYRRQPEARWVE